MEKIVIWWLVTAFLLSTAEAYKILVVFPIPAKSHGILGEAVSRHLVNAGHEVTFITPYPKENPHSNLRYIDVSEVKTKVPDVLNIKRIMDNKVNMNNENFMFELLVGLTKFALQHKNVQALLNDPKETFDVVIPEWMLSDIHTGLVAVFGCPIVWFFPLDNFYAMFDLMGEIPNPAYTASIRSRATPPFSFVQRLNFLWRFITTAMMKYFYHLPKDTEIYTEVFAPIVAKRNRFLPSLSESRRNGSLVLINSYVSLVEPLSVPRNFINIGGFHVDEDVKPLPDHLKKIMDEANNGVIYFSMGSNLQSKELPDELKKGLLQMFGSLKQTVLWKFEEILPNSPKNVHILQWAPQLSILSHPNCVLFITHGGLLSTTETIHFGVPIIGIPVFADQFLNTDRAVTKGFAKRVDLSYEMVDKLKLAIEDIINDPKYRHKAKELSMVYHDRPVSPGAELVYWVEHVVRTRGAPHLRSPALMVPWYQKMYLDLLALILAVLLIMKTAIKWLLLSFSSKKSNSRKKNN